MRTHNNEKCPRSHPSVSLPLEKIKAPDELSPSGVLSILKMGQSIIIGREDMWMNNKQQALDAHTHMHKNQVFLLDVNVLFSTKYF